MRNKFIASLFLILMLVSGLSMAANGEGDFAWLISLQPYLLFDLFVLVTGICGYWLYKMCFHLRASH